MPTFRFSAVTPNWFASVMGTGIVANAAAVLPVQVPGQRQFALAVWMLAAALLVFFAVATAVHWARHPETARSHHLDPVMAHFYGAVPMAVLTVGIGTLLVGRDVVGLHAALVIDGVLWVLGTLLAVFSAIAVPYLSFTHHENAVDAAFGGWLMPIVPPMVAATSGGLLLPYLAPGQARATMLLGCYALFGMSLVAVLIVLSQLWGRLVVHGIGQSATVPTLWIVLGPLGQSITAVNLLAAGAAGAAGTLGPAFDESLADFAIVFGVAVLGFALMWMGIAIAVTLRAVARGLPFSLTWWSFTFPIGTCVTGTAGLALRTHLVALDALSVVLFVGLLAAWITVAVLTALAQRPRLRMLQVAR